MKTFVAAMLSALLLWGCVDDGKHGEVTITSDKTNIDLVGSESASIDFEATDVWYARVVYDNPADTVRWITMSPMSGRAGSGSVTISANIPNHTGILRGATIEIKTPLGDAAVATATQDPTEKITRLESITRRWENSYGSLGADTTLAFTYDVFDRVTEFTLAGLPYTISSEDPATGSVIWGAESYFDFTLSGGAISSASSSSTSIAGTEFTSWDFSYAGGTLAAIGIDAELELPDGAGVDPLYTEDYIYAFDGGRIASSSHESADAAGNSSEVTHTFSYAASIEVNDINVNVWDFIAQPRDFGAFLYNSTGLTGTLPPALPSASHFARRTVTLPEPEEPQEPEGEEGADPGDSGDATEPEDEEPAEQPEPIVTESESDFTHEYERDQTTGLIRRIVVKSGDESFIYELTYEKPEETPESEL